MDLLCTSPRTSIESRPTTIGLIFPVRASTRPLMSSLARTDIAVWFEGQLHRSGRLPRTAASLALVEESWLPTQMLAKTSLGGGRSPHPESARLVIYRVPGPNGETSPGTRSVTLAWYDATRTQWLRERGYLVGDEVMGSVLASGVDDELRAELLAIATRRWRGTAREIITAAIEHKVIFGTPLAEYLPEQLVAGRLALVGDAAHVASPMVGAGLSSDLEDGIAFIAAVHRSEGTAGEAGNQALRLYDKVRLAPNRRRVLESLAETQALLGSTVAR